MANWKVSNSGTQLADGAEDILDTDTSNNTFVLFVDLTNMQNGDTVELRLYTKILSGSTLHVCWKGTYSNAPAIPIAVSPFVGSDQSFRATLKQTAGTNRNYDWKVLAQ